MNNTLTKVKTYVKNGDWSVFEASWLIISAAIITTLSFMWQDTLIGFISSISGILCVVFAAKGRIETYFFGIVQASTYAYISFSYQLYGEAMLNALFFLPVQFIGIYLWRKHKKTAEDRIHGEYVVMKRLKAKQWAWLAPLIVSSAVAYTFLLASLSSQQPGLDSATVALSIFAQFLMLFRYAEQWLLWVIINVLTIILWFLILTDQGGNDWTVFTMWVAFLVNSIYGYVNWLKISKQQETQENLSVSKV